jgi:2-polyprenyl-3-methyl-5-hydroxy-6-metoxy-1,4-benzoquinol methylase
MGKINPVIEDDVLAGNAYDKYNTRNPVARRMVDGFLDTACSLLASTGATDVHEVGCGEGLLSLEFADHIANLVQRGSDFSTQVIDAARRNAEQAGRAIEFKVASVYDLNPAHDAAECMVCCEVLEHLEEPDRALRVLARLAQPWLLVSVPREPLWRALNMLRGKYLTAAGNTSGHLQHWSSRSFRRFLEREVEIVEFRRPVPWSMALCRAKQ